MFSLSHVGPDDDDDDDRADAKLEMILISSTVPSCNHRWVTLYVMEAYHTAGTTPVMAVTVRRAAP